MYVPCVQQSKNLVNIWNWLLYVYIFFIIYTKDRLFQHVCFVFCRNKQTPEVTGRYCIAFVYLADKITLYSEVVIYL